MKSTSKTAAEKLTGVPAKKEYEQLIKRALEIQDTMSPLKTELEEIKDFFKDELIGNKTENRLNTPSGAVTLRITNSYSVLPESVTGLKKVFKDDFGIFVDENVTFKPTAALRKLLLDADYKHSKVIREAVLIREQPSVVFEPVTKIVKGGKY